VFALAGSIPAAAVYILERYWTWKLWELRRYLALHRRMNARAAALPAPGMSRHLGDVDAQLICITRMTESIGTLGGDRGRPASCVVAP